MPGVYTHQVVSGKLEWSQASYVTQEKSGMSCCDRADDYSRPGRFSEEVMRHGRGQFKDWKKTIHSKKYYGQRFLLGT